MEFESVDYSELVVFNRLLLWRSDRSRNSRGYSADSTIYIILIKVFWEYTDKLVNRGENMGWGQVTDCKMKYKVRSNTYRNSTGSNIFKPDSIEAWSYDWWQYVKKEGKLVIFNDYNYSQSTNTHQCATREIMAKLKIKIDLVVYSSKGLQNDGWREEVFSNIYKRLFLAEYRLARKGSTKAFKAKCKETIKQCQKELTKLGKIKNPLTKKSLRDLKVDVISEYEAELDVKRKEAKEMREMRKAMESKIQSELNDLSPLGKYESYNDLNNLESI